MHSQSVENAIYPPQSALITAGDYFASDRRSQKLPFGSRTNTLRYRQPLMTLAAVMAFALPVAHDVDPSKKALTTAWCTFGVDHHLAPDETPELTVRHEAAALALTPRFPLVPAAQAIDQAQKLVGPSPRNWNLARGRQRIRPCDRAYYHSLSLLCSRIRVAPAKHHWRVAAKQAAAET